MRKLTLGKLTLRFLIALLTFALGVAAATLWAVSYFQHRKSSADATLSSSKLGVRPEGDVPEGWLEVEMDGIATFYLPAGLKQKLYGNCSGRTFYDEHVQISFTYGSCASGTCGVHRFLQEARDSELSKVTVNGKIATLNDAGKTTLNLDEGGPIVSEMTICVPDVGGEHGFSIVAKYKDDQDLKTVQQVINSIKFP